MPESPLSHHKSVSILIRVICFITILVAVYGVAVSWRYITSVRQNITATETAMRTLVRQLDNNTDASALQAIISDCPASDQTLYDTNLTQLATISGADLQLTARLFQACALSRPERRLIMADQLGMQEATYESYVALITRVVWPLPVVHYPRATWSTLARLEEERARAVMELVTIQGKIIDARVAGESPTGTVIGGLLGQAVVTKQTIGKLNTEIKDQETALGGI